MGGDLNQLHPNPRKNPKKDPKEIRNEATPQGLKRPLSKTKRQKEIHP